MTQPQPTATNQSFEKSAIPLLLALKPSRARRIVTVFCHFAAILAVFLANLPLALQLLISAVIVYSLHHNYRSDGQSQRVIWRSGNRWVIEESVFITHHTSNDLTDHLTEDLIDYVADGNDHPTYKQTLNATSANKTPAKNYESTAAELYRIDFFSRWLVILTLKTETGRKDKFVIPFDALSRDCLLYTSPSPRDS